MSHSKFTKRGYSHYVENWNPDAKRFINTCAICGHKGYSPAIKEEDFCVDGMKCAISKELTKVLNELRLDELGRCEYCAKIQEESQNE